MSESSYSYKTHHPHIHICIYEPPHTHPSDPTQPFNPSILSPSLPLPLPSPHLPSDPRQHAPRPLPHRPLPRLIHKQQPQPKSHRQKKVLDRDIRGTENILQARRVAKDEDNDEGEEDGGEEVEILCRFVEGGWVLEDGEVARAGCHEVEPLPGT